MSENKGSTTLEVALAFLLGGIVGAGIALLAAPCSGAETRKKIRENADVVAGQLRKSIGGLAESAGTRLAGVGESARGAFEETKHRSSAAISAARTAWDESGRKENV